ncbi:hypothetical protein [Paenibacillus sp.]|uniref:hypothetical protein n=1 Tax=Paenibacillus sp. TaxID=58172 RepID=UPI002D56C32B|nr:hypothetical protein [Paenibacillus sp.]HZG87171.1 hypothetical protein [Paenibacillus sp.]
MKFATFKIDGAERHCSDRCDPCGRGCRLAARHVELIASGRMREAVAWYRDGGAG